MLPVAIALFQRGEAMQWLERAKAVNGEGTCVFYQPDPLIPGNGRCQAYQWRPSVCRLFGFATVTNKLGQPEFEACSRHKAEVPEMIANVQSAIAQGLPAPNFAELSQQVTSLDPYLGDRLKHISRGKVAIQQRLLEIFIETTTQDLEALGSAIIHQNFAQVEHYAHRLKGSASNVGVPLLSTIAAQLETMARQQTLESAEEHLKELQYLLKKVEASVPGLSIT